MQEIGLHCALSNGVGCLFHSLNIVPPLELTMQSQGGAEALNHQEGGSLPQALSGRGTGITQKTKVLVRPSTIKSGMGLPQNRLVL